MYSRFLEYYLGHRCKYLYQILPPRILLSHCSELHEVWTILDGKFRIKLFRHSFSVRNFSHLMYFTLHAVLGGSFR